VLLYRIKETFKVQTVGFDCRSQKKKIITEIKVQYSICLTLRFLFSCKTMFFT